MTETAADSLWGPLDSVMTDIALFVFLSEGAYVP